MNDSSPPGDPRLRLRELRAIPERNRTDAQWDELNELEIQFAPGNRIDGPAQAWKPDTAAARRLRNDRNKPMGRRDQPGRPPPKAKSDMTPR